MRLSLVALFPLLATLATAAPRLFERNPGVKIPLTKRAIKIVANDAVDFSAMNSHLASVKRKILRGLENYEKNTGSPHPFALKNIEKRGAGDPLTDYNNQLWYGAISVGTPGQTFTVDFDTGSSDFILPSTECDSSCAGHTLWDSSSSSTASDLGQTFSASYGDGATVEGELFSDTVNLVGFTATSQTIGAATTYSASLAVNYFPPDGISGMAFEQLSTYGANSIIQTLISEGAVSPSVFSLMLASSGSELYLGGSDSSLYTGGFSYAPITVVGYWQVTMDNVQGNGQTLQQNIASIIDSGTEYVVGVPSDVAAISSALGGTSVSAVNGNGYDYYTFPCDSFPTIGFTFGGTTFNLNPSAVNLGPTSSGSSDCVSGLVGADTGASFWIVGDVFLQGVYTAFDVGNSQVGFAQLA